MSGHLSVETIGALVGGLGLFLLAVGMITDGLRLAAGDALRTMLGQWTRTALRGIGSGALITAIVQSSSAVTVATIGFVNANLLTMEQALGVVYGANVGTTMTGWLVAAVGFEIKVEAFALPMIGVGMVMRLTGAGTRRSAIGEALAGFGLFFIGIDVLRTAFEGLAQNVDLASIGSQTPAAMLVFAGTGFFMTLVTQSSSAAIAIILTAATGGMVPLSSAAAMVIGANVGTTSTAGFAAIGATPNAKRVAVAHVVFNLATGVVALLMLPGLLWFVDMMAKVMNLEAVPAVALAIFHTLFNVIGVVLLWPFTARLAAFLRRRFVSVGEDLGQPRHLDTTTLGTPNLALDAIRLELFRIVDLLRQLSMVTVTEPLDRARFQSLAQAIERLSDVVDQSIERIERIRLAPEIARALPDVLRITHHVREALDAAKLGARPGEGNAELVGFAELVDRELRTWQPQTSLSDTGVTERFSRIEHSYRVARDAVLTQAAEGHLSARRAHATVELLRYRFRVIEQTQKAARRTEALRPPVDPMSPEALPGQ